MNICPRLRSGANKQKENNNPPQNYFIIFLVHLNQPCLILVITYISQNALHFHSTAFNHIWMQGKIKTYVQNAVTVFEVDFAAE